MCDNHGDNLGGVDSGAFETTVVVQQTKEADMYDDRSPQSQHRFGMQKCDGNIFIGRRPY